MGYVVLGRNHYKIVDFRVIVFVICHEIMLHNSIPQVSVACGNRSLLLFTFHL